MTTIIVFGQCTEYIIHLDAYFCYLTLTVSFVSIQLFLCFGTRSNGLHARKMIGAGWKRNKIFNSFLVTLILDFGDYRNPIGILARLQPPQGSKQCRFDSLDSFFE